MSLDFVQHNPSSNWKINRSLGENKKVTIIGMVSVVVTCPTKPIPKVIYQQFSIKSMHFCA